MFPKIQMTGPFGRLISKLQTILFAALVLWVFMLPTSNALSKNVTVAITQIIQHPSLDAIRQGILDELKDQGFVEGKNLRVLYESAQGSIPTAIQIAQNFVSHAPDVCVAIATPSAQAMIKAARPEGIPLVFGAVTDPVSAGIVKSLDEPSPGVTGTIDLPPAKKQIKFAQAFIPNLKRLGVLYNPGESNTVAQITGIKREAETLGLEVLEATVAKTSDVTVGAFHLVEKAQAIFVANDNTVVAALEALLRVADQHNIPVFVSDPESVERGALGALANDQYGVGRETGQLVARILKGQSPETIPVLQVQTTKTYVNNDVAKRLGLQVPKGLEDSRK